MICGVTQLPEIDEGGKLASIQGDSLMKNCSAFLNFELVDISMYPVLRFKCYKCGLLSLAPPDDFLPLSFHFPSVLHSGLKLVCVFSPTDNLPANPETEGVAKNDDDEKRC